MTLSEALSLPAGPELDAIVAERVMGAKVYDEVRGERPSRSSELCVMRSYTQAWTGTLNYGIWQPSANIAHAFEVVEKMDVQEFAFKRGKAPMTGVWCVAKIADHERQIYSEGYISAETLPLAICRAALKAVWKE